MDRKETEEVWLHAQVGPAFDALKTNPGRTVTADQVRARLADIAQAIGQAGGPVASMGAENPLRPLTRPKT